MLKLHLACGPVYLKGWVNIDIKGELAEKRPDLIKNNSTDIAHYFKTSYVKKPFGHNKRGKIVLDVKANVLDLSMFQDESVSKILTVNLINHLRFQDFPRAMKEWHRILKKNGELIIDIDDVKKHAQMLVDAKNTEQLEWALRLIYCHSRDKYDSHHWGFTPTYLATLLGSYGYKHKWTKRDFIAHVYPAFQMCVTKI